MAEKMQINVQICLKNMYDKGSVWRAHLLNFAIFSANNFQFV